MMTILTPSSWTTFLDCVGSMKTRWLLPRSPLWLIHSSVHLHKSIDTTMDGKIQALDLFVMLHLNLHMAILMTITTWCHPFHGLYDIFLLTQAHGNTPNPHIELSRRPWVSTQIRNGQCLPYHGITWSLSVHLLRFVSWSTWFTLDLVLINLESLQLSSFGWCLEGKHEWSHNLLIQDMLSISSTLTWPIFG